MISAFTGYPIPKGGWIVEIAMRKFPDCRSEKQGVENVELSPGPKIGQGIFDDQGK